MSGRNFNRGTRGGAALVAVLIANVLVACGGSSTPATTGSAGNGAAASTPSTQTQTQTQTHAHPDKSSSGAPNSGAQAPRTPHKPAGKLDAQEYRAALKRALKSASRLKSGSVKARPGTPRGLEGVYAVPETLGACLHKQGIPLAAGSKLPSGVSRARYQAALKACGHAIKLPKVSLPSRTGSAAEFVKCMRRHGIDMPPLETSARGPRVSFQGVDTSSENFKGAMKKCRAHLPGLAEIELAPPVGGASGP
ncbi:MAG TPA: hypothetical protein VMI13_05110 [Solirubrobacteraceae bacterium]|nr:hypothetical protein [Solirubrobacteraceae bacterium]